MTEVLATSSSRTDPGWVRAVDRISLVLGGIGAAAALLLVINILADVTGRAALNRSIPGTLDFVTFWWMPLLALLPLALAERRGEHIAVTLLTEQLEGVTRKIVGVFGVVVAMLGVAALLYFSVLAAIDSVEKLEAAISVTWLPVWPVKVIVIAAVAAFLLQLVLTLRRVILGIEPTTDDEIPTEGAV